MSTAEKTPVEIDDESDIDRRIRQAHGAVALALSQHPGKWGLRPTRRPMIEWVTNVRAASVKLTGIDAAPSCQLFRAFLRCAGDKIETALVVKREHVSLAYLESALGYLTLAKSERMMLAVSEWRIFDAETEIVFDVYASEAAARGDWDRAAKLNPGSLLELHSRIANGDWEVVR